MIKRDRRRNSYCDVTGEILGSPQDGQKRSHLPRMFSLIKNDSLEVRRRSDTALVLTINDDSQQSAEVPPMTRRAASGKPELLCSGGRTDAKLKLN